MVVRIHRIALVQQLLIALHHRVHILGGLHFHAGFADGILQGQKVLAQVVVDGDGLVTLPDGELADIAQAACALQQQLAAEDEALRLPDQVQQGGFAGAVAADHGAVAVFFQSKGNILKQIGSVESKGQFFCFNHENPSIYT